MKCPTHLSHKPIVSVDDYDKIDGMYAGKSDAKALSIGLAQYDENSVAAKIFRHTGAKWSRQSEELPLHRVLDLAILIVSLYYPLNNAPMSPIIAGYPNNNVEKPASHLQPTVQNDLQALYDYLSEDDDFLRPRLRELRNLLNGLNL